MNRKIWKALGIAVCMLALAAPRAMAETKVHVVTADTNFAEVVKTINATDVRDENVIELCADITLTGNYTLKRNTTIKSENGDCKISINGLNAGITVTGGTVLNLGANGYDKKLTIEGDTKVAFITVSGGATANMYENVTLQNRQQVDQACVVLEENSVFNMHGGVIQNCKGKYGGVSLKNGSRFIMEGGTISGCSASEGGGLYATNQSTITISGGTISGCTAGGGGGLYAENNSTITISGGKIEDNEATRSGGGLLVKGSTLNIEGEGGTISGCKGTMGGGLYVTTGSKLTIKGGTISGCTETSMGGGLYVIGSNLTIEGGTISECTAKSMGGGLYAENSTITISGGTIEKNEAAYSGGGLYAKDSSTITISGGTIEKNRAMYGGGVALNSSTINNPIKNWKVIGNEAYKLDSSIGGIGGGIYLTNGSMDVSAGSNRIYNNTAGGQGADIFLHNGNASIKLPNAANMGATFGNSGIKIDGWYNDNPRYTPSKDVDPVDVSETLTNPRSLVASYKADPVRIEIDANGGKGGSGSQTVQKGTNVTLEAPTKEGHLFTGWKDEKGNSYPAGEDGKVKITVTSDMTLTAVWEARTFTVTYVLLDGKTRTETADYGKTVTLGEEPRTGYTFVGWKDGEKMYHAGETITVTGDMTLTAEWKKLPSAENLPKTGDESPVLLWGAALAVSAAVCFMLRRRK